MKLDSMERSCFFNENSSNNYQDYYHLNQERWFVENENNLCKKSDPNTLYSEEKHKKNRLVFTKNRLRSEKAPHVVAKRNARERRRVEAVNNAFAKLRKVVPIENTRGKRVSKVKTLQKAIEYIAMLDNLLQGHEDFGQTVEHQNNMSYFTNYEHIHFESIQEPEF